MLLLYYNILKIIKLYAKKYSILTSNLSFYTYENTIGTYINKNIIRIILYNFWFILLLSNIYTILRKNKNIDDILLLKRKYIVYLQRLLSYAEALAEADG